MEEKWQSATEEVPVYENSKEICREDSKGRFLTIADNTNFLSHYEYIFVTPDSQKQGQNKVKPPFHKVCLNLVVYEPKPNEGKKYSHKHYMEVDEFLLLSDEILFRQTPPDPAKFQYGVEVLKFVGFSAKKKEGRELIIHQIASQKDPSKSTYKFSFVWGNAEVKTDGVGFKYIGKPSNGDIYFQEQQARKMVLEAKNHIESMRVATNTIYFESLYVKKSNS